MSATGKASPQVGPTVDELLPEKSNKGCWSRVYDKLEDLMLEGRGYVVENTGSSRPRDSVKVSSSREA